MVKTFVKKESVIKIPAGRKLERMSFTVQGVPVGMNRGMQQLLTIQEN
jgi:hypothetical protein